MFHLELRGSHVVRVPRPAHTTAGAVLLLVVGPQLLLVALGCMGVLVAWAIEDATLPNFWLLLVLTLLFAVACDVVVIGVKLLRGSLQNLWQSLDRLNAYGAFALLPAIGSLFCCGLGVVMDRERMWTNLTADKARILGLLALSWGNVASLCTASILLRRGAGRYLDWRETVQRPREASEYEQE